MGIVRRLFSIFAGGGHGRRTRGRSGSGGLLSLVGRFLGGSRGRQRTTTRF